METVTRYDFAPIRAKVTEDGYIIDSPIVSRAGIFEYRRSDGTVRKELRRHDAVFDPLHLASLKGKPVTDGHPGYVSAKNARQHVVGTVLSEGRQDGDNLTADIVIYDTDPVLKGGKRELSLGYSVTLKEEPGEWNGQKFDAEQVAMVVNHCAVVPRGRAGVARLNLDGADAEEVTEDAAPEPAPSPDPQPAPPPPAPAAPPPAAPPPQEKPTVTEPHAPLSAPDAARQVLCRIDGLEYPAPREVARELDRIREDAKAVAQRADTAEAERDALKAQIAKHEAEREQIRLDAATAARARVKLETEAGKHGVDVRSDMADRDLREAVIRKIRGADVRFDGKSDDYVGAAFDIAVAEAAKAADQNARNRAIVSPPVPGSARADAAIPGQPSLVSAAAARERMIRNSLAAR